MNCMFHVLKEGVLTNLKYIETPDSSWRVLCSTTLSYLNNVGKCVGAFQMKT